MKHQTNNFEKKSHLSTHRPSLKWKIVRALFFFTAIIILILWLFQVVFLERIYESIKYQQLESSASAIEKSTSEADLEKRVEKYAEKYEICITVYNNTKRLVLCTSDTMKQCVLHRYLQITTPDGTVAFNQKLCNQYRDEVIKAGGSVYIENHIQFDNNMPMPAPATEDKNVMMVMRLFDQEGDEILIFLNTVLKPVSATVTTLNSMLLIISILILFIATVVGLTLSHRIAKPISGITKEARRLAGGDYDVTFTGGSSREIEELAYTLNFAASELSKVDSLKNDLMANISHDLRTPLTLITGYAEMMRDLPDESTPENLQIIIDEAERMKSLVNDVLDISKIQSGTNAFEMELFPLTNCIESELTRYNKLRDKEGFLIRFEYNEMVTVNGDCGCIMRAVYNLVNNAVTHAGADKEIIVRQIVDTKHQKVRISVSDSGEGIDADKLELIWERYYKVDKTHKRAQIGTGLGLSIVKNIITAHGGTYGVTSTKGKGSTFYFELDYIRVEPMIKIYENGETQT